MRSPLTLLFSRLNHPSSLTILHYKPGKVEDIDAAMKIFFCVHMSENKGYVKRLLIF